MTRLRFQLSGRGSSRYLEGSRQGGMTDSRSTWTHAACPLVLAVGLRLAPTRVLGAEQAILGSQVIIKNPGPPEMRKIVVDAKEKASGNSIVGDPVAHGATLTIRAEGETTTSQSFHL